jgi:ERCC4-related helicase
MKKDYFRERDFDLVILDEASDSTLARDFLEKYRMSYYLEGLERWSNLKLLLFPKKVKEEKLDEMIKKFNEKLSELIRKEPESIKKLEYNIKDPILIDDPLVNEFVEILDDEYRGIRRKVTNLLKKFNVKGYQENLETLLQHKMMARVKKIYQLDDDTVNAIQVMITKYILMKHLRKWFLYSNREELKRTLLASQFQVREWLENEDKKLAKLKATISDLLCKNKRIYIYSEYISTAEMIFNYLKEELDLKDEDMEMITGKVEDQYERLNNFKEDGKILIATPVFDKGTDIPEVDSIIIFTPPANMEKMHQIKGRIRGGDVIMLAYKGREEEIIEETVRLLRD